MVTVPSLMKPNARVPELFPTPVPAWEIADSVSFVAKDQSSFA